MKQITVVLSLLLPACAALMPGLSPRSAKPHTAQNPVAAGTALEYRAAPDDPQIASLTQATCDRFPFEDVYAVHATAAQVCVDYTAVRAGDTASESSTWFLLATEANASAKDKPKLDLDLKGSPRKVALCNPRGKPVGIWEVSYSGCLPNNGLVSTTTQRLELRNVGLTGEAAIAAWTF